MVECSLVDYGILCFKPEEFEALLRRFGDEVEVAVREARRHYAFRRMRTNDGRHATIALVRTVMQGTAEAQNAATDLIEDLHPRCLVVSGIAGTGPSTDVFVGDVVLATQIHDFNLRANKDEGDELATAGYPIHRNVGVFIAALAGMRGQLGDWNSDHELNCQRPSVAQSDPDRVRGTDAWKDRVRQAIEHHRERDRPRFVDGPIASSDDLVRAEAAMQERLDVDRRILAAEMESAGVAKACIRQQGVTPLVVVRAISDIVGLDRTEDHTAYACNVAASFTKALVRVDLAERIDPDTAGRVASSRATELVRVGASLEDLAPSVVFQRAFQLEPGELEAIVGHSVGAVERVGESGEYLRFRLESNGSPDRGFVQSTLYELLNYIESRKTVEAAMGQCRNALSLFEQLEAAGRSLVAERMFDVLDKRVKSLGDKRLVIEVAEACIAAVSHGSRSRGEAECEARARICGLSWAYQRMGMLDRAAEEAHASVELARFLESRVNLAFGMKCNGRLARLRAEAAIGDRETRNRLLQESVSMLQEAARTFSEHDAFGPDHSEVGDCYSLLGRTCLVMGNVRQAERHVEQATALLADTTSKGYLDLEILKGELAARRGDHAAAHAHFRVVLGSGADGDYQRSEIVARAFMERARVFVRTEELGKAEGDYERAADIWDHYGERELAGKAQWEALAARQKFPRRTLRIWESEPSFAVRAAACRRYVGGGEGARGKVLARRQRHDEQIVRRCLADAREAEALRRESE